MGVVVVGVVVGVVVVVGWVVGILVAVGMEVGTAVVIETELDISTIDEVIRSDVSIRDVNDTPVLVGKSSVVDCDVEGLSVRIPTVVEIIADTMLVETSEVNGSIFENATVDSLLFIGTAIIVEEEEISSDLMTLCDKLASIEDDDISIEGKDMIDSLAFLSKSIVENVDVSIVVSTERDVKTDDGSINKYVELITSTTSVEITLEVLTDVVSSIMTVVMLNDVSMTTDDTPCDDLKKYVDGVITRDIFKGVSTEADDTTCDDIKLVVLKVIVSFKVSVNEGCISSDEKMTIDGVVATVILKSVSMAADDISSVELTVIVGCIMIGKVEAAVETKSDIKDAESNDTLGKNVTMEIFPETDSIPFWNIVESSDFISLIDTFNVGKMSDVNVEFEKRPLIIDVCWYKVVIGSVVRLKVNIDWVGISVVEKFRKSNEDITRSEVAVKINISELDMIGKMSEVI